jgi:hypothetical protein
MYSLPDLGIIEEYTSDNVKYHGELITLAAAEKITGRKFITVRPNFLLNRSTGENLELDCFNVELRLAIEYNGEQHYRFVPEFHYDIQSFHRQQDRDILKINLCEKFGVILIIVPYTVRKFRIEHYLKIHIPKIMHAE